MSTSTSTTAARPPRHRHRPAPDPTLESAVLAACRRLDSAGVYPSCQAMQRLVPGRAPMTLLRVRDRLVESGRLAIATPRGAPGPPPDEALREKRERDRAAARERYRRRHRPRTVTHHGLGSDPAARAELAERVAAVRAAKRRKWAAAGVADLTIEELDAVLPWGPDEAGTDTDTETTTDT